MRERERLSNQMYSRIHVIWASICASLLVRSKNSVVAACQHTARVLRACHPPSSVLSLGSSLLRGRRPCGRGSDPQVNTPARRVGRPPAPCTDLPQAWLRATTLTSPARARACRCASRVCQASNASCRFLQARTSSITACLLLPARLLFLPPGAWRLLLPAVCCPLRAC